MDNLKELKAAAEACGPLPWRLIEIGVTRLGVRDDHGYIAFMDIGHPAKYGACPEREAKARFIGHATPAAVLALIAENQAMAEFKAHMVSLRETSGFDSWTAVLVDLDRLKAENEALRKRIDDMSPFKGAPQTGPDTKCLACGGYHYGMSGLPCPKMTPVAQALSMENQRITPVEPLRVPHPLDAAMDKGEQP